MHSFPNKSTFCWGYLVQLWWNKLKVAYYTITLLCYISNKYFHNGMNRQQYPKLFSHPQSPSCLLPQAINLSRNSVTYQPYAVPSWCSGVTNATIGHSAQARTEYATPMMHC